MKILHGTWIPSSTNNFIQEGQFYLWIEIIENRRRSKNNPHLYPRQLTREDLAQFIDKELGIKNDKYDPQISPITSQYFLLPSSDNQPLPSLTLSRYLETESPETSELQYWSIDCFPLPEIIKNLNDIHFLALYQSQEWVLGIDLLFWYYYTQNFKQIILKDQYIPALKYRQLNKKKTAKSKKQSFEIYPCWTIASGHYQSIIQQAIATMPLACVSGFEEISESSDLYDKEGLLHHFSECLLNQIIVNTPLPNVFTKKIDNCELIRDSLSPTPIPWIYQARVSSSNFV